MATVEVERGSPFTRSHTFMAPRNAQVEHLEEALSRRLYPLRNPPLVKWRNSGRYELDSDGNITGLNLHRARITDASCLRRLSSLTRLQLGDSLIEDWSFLGSLTSLRSLHLSGNTIRDASSLGRLGGLRALNLSHVRGLTRFSFLRRLTSLEYLDLRNSGIADISCLSPLCALAEAYLADNHIADLMPLAGVKSLRTADLSNNRITSLPRSLLGLDLRISVDLGPVTGCLTLAGNPITSPPADWLRRGHADVQAWLEALDVDEPRPLRQVRLILIGDGKAGKTSLRKRLMGELANLSESQTHGIEINKWKVNARGEEILVHFWDFGGQEIMHATHQFFLSSRSVYVLVLDGRQGSDHEYWLKNIESFGGDSSIVVVINKIDENPGYDVNRPFLSDKYAGIREYFRVTCLDPAHAGVDALRSYLLGELAVTEFATTMWPGSFFRVKERLEATNRDYISYDEYEAACGDAGVADPAHRRALVRCLHDLGTALHFEDTRLRTTQVLNPHWVTNGVYHIVTARELAHSGGILRLEQLDAIVERASTPQWRYPRDTFGYLVDLMKKFELCYELDPERILVPDLLPVAEPPIGPLPAELLRFRFQYDFLPRSVLARFMVRHHRDIWNDVRWRTGLELRDIELDARAVIRADHRERTISVDVAGASRREYFRRLRKGFDDIHDDFNLKIETKVPLPGGAGHSVAYDDLIYHEQEGQRFVLVGALRQKFAVQGLLNGLEYEQERAFARRYRKETARELVQAPVARPQFDVFICHNRADRHEVTELNGLLQGRGLRTWFDDEQLRPGLLWISEVEGALRSSQAAVVCVGRNGFGEWHEQEMDALLRLRGRGQSTRPLIPVFLPGAAEAFVLPPFLAGPTYVDFRHGFSEEGLARLEWGITGKKRRGRG